MKLPDWPPDITGQLPPPLELLEDELLLDELDEEDELLLDDELDEEELLELLLTPFNT